MGGVGHLSLGSYEGEQTTYTPAGFKVNLDGTLSATRAKVATKAKPSQLEQTHDRFKDPYGFFDWRSVALYINQNEPPESVSALDRSLRTQLAKNIWQNEASPLGLAGDTLLTWWYLYINSNDTEAIALKLTAAPVLQHLFRIGFLNINNQNPYKWSTQSFTRPDRAALASAHLIGKLITPVQT